jgi:hypothetical protein
MKKIFILLLTSAFVITLNAQDMNDQAKKETTAFLQSMKSTVNKDNYKMFGFESFEDMGSLSADRVYPTMIIRLDNLKKYDGVSDVKPLLTDVNRYVCTIRNNRSQQTVAMVDIERTNEKIVVKGFSNSDIGKALDKIDKNLLKEKLSIVRIPALNFYFASFTDANNKVQFINLQKNTSLKAELGEVREASKYLMELVPIADAYNGLPW